MLNRLMGSNANVFENRTSSLVKQDTRIESFKCLHISVPEKKKSKLCLFCAVSVLHVTRYHVFQGFSVDAKTLSQSHADAK